MLPTYILIALLLGTLAFSWVLWGAFLAIGLRWAKVPGISTSRIVAATIVISVTQIVLAILVRSAPASSDAIKFLLALSELAAAVAVPCLVIALVFQANLLRSLQAWLVTLFPSIAMLAFALLVFRPFLFEAFFCPTNGMAPTLLGAHCRAKCPQCGQSNFCSLHEVESPQADSPLMICGSFHVAPTQSVDPREFPPDYFLVAKFLALKRWDIAVFQFPEQPSTLYAMRLVGLPGETIHIEDGAVWVNGQKLTPPNSLSGLEYESEPPNSYRGMWGTKDRPAILGPDEYFVLGDFSARSADSRYWEEGARGYSSYAVPKSHLKGVVTHIYWPPSRWRIFR